MVKSDEPDSRYGDEIGPDSSPDSYAELPRDDVCIVMALTPQHEKLRELISGVKIAMMTTFDGEQLHSRPMWTVEMDPDGVLWFFTAHGSPKTEELERNGVVNLAYAQPDLDRYVSVAGEAMVVRDEERQKRMWSPMMDVWFDGGPTSPAVRLIRVDVRTAEYWDEPGSKMVKTLKMAAAAITGTRPDTGEHGTIILG